MKNGKSMHGQMWNLTIQLLHFSSLWHPAWPKYRNRIEFGRRYGSKKTDKAKKLTTEASTLLGKSFLSVGLANTICVWRSFYTLPFCLHKFTDHMMTKSPETHSLQRGVKKKYLYFVKPIRFWASLNFNHTKINIWRGKQAYLYVGSSVRQSL